LLFKMGDSQAAFREINTLLGQAVTLDWVWGYCARLVSRFARLSADVAPKTLRFWRAYLREHPQDTAAKREHLLCLLLLRSVGECAEMGFDEFKLEVTQLIERGDADPAFLWDRIGHWAQYDNDWAQAEVAYRRAHELEPRAYGYCLGTALNFLGRHREALSILTPLVKQESVDATLWFQIAIAHERLANIDGSIAAYGRALELDADYDIAWFNLGGIYWNSGDIVRAVRVWREAAGRFPDHESTRKLREGFPFIFMG
jgi:tetratricopeptide (TPR) repeat protein